ncbi:unnamed protein product, partial [Didymodactylos carnosus]
MPIEMRLERLKMLSEKVDEANNHIRELSRTQRLLTSKGHRLEQIGGGGSISELSSNLKTIESQLNNEIERMERAVQAEINLHEIEKELDVYMNTCAEQLKSSQYHPEKSTIYQTVSDRLIQAEHGFEKLLTLSERLSHDIPTEQFDVIQHSIQRRQERLQTLIKSCSQSKLDHEQMLKTQHKLHEELFSLHDWLKRLTNDLSYPIELNLSLNSVNDAQDVVTQLTSSIDQRLAHLEQLLHDESSLLTSNKGEVYTQQTRERLEELEQTKQQIQSLLNQRRHTLEDIHQRMSQFLKVVNDVKTTIRLNEAVKLSDSLRPHLRNNARDLCDTQIRNHHQIIEDL